MKRALLILALLLSACGPGLPYVWVTDLPRAAAAPGGVLRASDRIFLLVRGQEAITGELQIRADGSVVGPVLGKVEIAGLSPASAAARIAEKLRGAVVNPEVTVAIVATSPSKVSVVGEVAHPGKYDIADGEGVLESLARAGGITEFADRDGIYVLRRVPARARIRFSYTLLAGGDAASGSFALEDGDVVVVE